MKDTKVKFTFAVSLFQKLCRDEKDNFVISPLSLGTALAVLTAGLRGKTQTELLELFGAENEDELHALYSDIMSKKDLPLKIVNELLAEKTLEVQKRFASLLKEKYESEVECVDFRNEANAIEVRVNEWAAKETNNMIPELLTKGTLTPDAILVILNAVYFKGSWLRKFRPVPGPRYFTLRGGEKVESNFIELESMDFGYHETEELRLLKIPYQEAGFYMVVAIPKSEDKDIDEVISGMQAADLITALQSFKRSGETFLVMPKFKIEYNFLNVINVMKELGVREIFQKDVGDFGNLFKGVEKGPCVDPIIHKAVIEVDEEGTTAAATTVVVVNMRSSNGPVRDVQLDRPFCFFIMSADGLVCFSGVCARP